MLPEEREDLPLGGGPAQKRGAIAVARSLSPIASAILLALIAVLLGASAPRPVLYGRSLLGKYPPHFVICSDVARAPEIDFIPLKASLSVRVSTRRKRRAYVTSLYPSPASRRFRRTRPCSYRMAWRGSASASASSPTPTSSSSTER